MRLPFPDAEQSPIDDRDIAAVAARALTSNDLNGQRIVLTGPESLSQRRQIELIGAALGKSIAVEQISESEARVALGLIVPPAYVDLLMSQWQDEVGVRSVVTDAVERITGRAPTAYRIWAQRNVHLFRRNPQLSRASFSSGPISLWRRQAWRRRSLGSCSLPSRSASVASWRARIWHIAQ